MAVLVRNVLYLLKNITQAAKEDIKRQSGIQAACPWRITLIHKLMLYRLKKIATKRSIFFWFCLLWLKYSKKNPSLLQTHSSVAGGKSSVRFGRFQG